MNARAWSGRGWALPSLALQDGTLEGLKWLGLVAMTGLEGINGNGWIWLPIPRHCDGFHLDDPPHRVVPWAIRRGWTGH